MPRSDRLFFTTLGSLQNELIFRLLLKITVERIIKVITLVFVGQKAVLLQRNN